MSEMVGGLIMVGHIVDTDSQNFENDILKCPLPVVVLFYSDDCHPCMAVLPVLERLAGRFDGHARFCRIFRPQNRQLAEKLGIRSSPALLFYKNGGEVCGRLTGYIGSAELRRSMENILGGTCPSPELQKAFCDVLILGGGPAGLTAAMYAGRAKLYSVLVDEGIPGGQVATTFHVANYPGTNGVIRGIDLVENMKRQALDFGTQLDDLKEIKQVRLTADEKYVKTEDTEYYAKTVILATGSQPRRLPAEGENEFRGRGVHYCAACDGAMYPDADILVVGGGNSAAEEAIFLTRYARHVTIVHQLDHFQASKGAQQEIFKNPAISVIWNSEIRKVSGTGFVNSAIIEDVKTGKQTELKTDGLFVFIGMQPGTSLFKDWIKLDIQGYIPTDEQMRTDVPGVFAAGDVRVKPVRQIATAVNDGAIAAIGADKYIGDMQTANDVSDPGSGV